MGFLACFCVLINSQFPRRSECTRQYILARRRQANMRVSHLSPAARNRRENLGRPPPQTPPAANERLIERAGFRQIRVTDTTESAARIAKRWHHAREKRKEELVAAEGNITFEGLQRFLSCVHTLAGEKRLLRCLYFASKESGA